MGIHNIEELFNLPPAKKKVMKNAGGDEVKKHELAPDSDEKGDALPDGFKDLISKKPDEPDNVDHREVDR